jgi:hypothetical protein
MGTFTGTIYKATCTANGKSYIGLTKNRLASRVSQHLHHAKSNRYPRNPFHSCIRKYGEHSILWETIFYGNVTIQELRDLEIQLIAEHGTHVSCGGLNLSLGGELFVSAESTSRMVATKREKGIFASAAAKSAETKKKLGIDKVSAQKSLATRIKNGTQLRGITHPKAKKYHINSPHGGVYIIHGELEMF